MQQTIIRVEDSLSGTGLAAVLTHIDLDAPPLLRLNPRLMTPRVRERAVQWAHRTLGAGQRVATLTAATIAALDDLDAI